MTCEICDRDMILVTEIGFKPKEAMLLYYDNHTVREITNNPIQHNRTKHVEVDRHFIKELDIKCGHLICEV